MTNKENMNETTELEGTHQSDVNTEVPKDNVEKVEFDTFSNGVNVQISQKTDPSLDILKDIEVDVSVELGRITIPIGEVLQLVKGSVVELENLAGEPIDVMVNGLKIAQGEVVVIDEHFGVRITKMITTKAIMSAVD